MATTPNLDITRLTAGQASAEVTMNDALNRLDVLVMPRVVNSTTTTAPTSPVAGDAYICAGVGGDWSTFTAKDVAFYDGGAWFNVGPEEGFVVYNLDSNDFMVYTGSAWIDYINNATDGQIEVISGHITSPVVKQFVLDQSAAYAYDISTMIHEIGGGTNLTFSLKIGNDPDATLTAITGISGEVSTGSETTETATANNTVAVGQSLILDITGNTATPVDFSFTIKTTRNSG